MIIFQQSIIPVLFAYLVVSQGVAAPIRVVYPSSDTALYAGSLTNIHIEYTASVQGILVLSLASCEADSKVMYQVIGKTEVSDTKKPTRFVWLIKNGSEKEACVRVSVKYGEIETVLGISEALIIRPTLGKRSENRETFFDAVKYYREQVSASDMFVVDDRKKTIGIVGAGIGGLFSALLLNSAGLDFEILEASNRIGGRIQTEYLSSEQGHLVELGAMRLPWASKYPWSNETVRVKDQKMVFELIDELNTINADRPDLQIRLRKWKISDPNSFMYFNGMRTADGRIPTVADMVTDPLLSGMPEYAANASLAMASLMTPELLKSMSEDLYTAHDMMIKQKYDDWGLFGWIHEKLGYSIDVTDLAVGEFVEGGLPILIYMMFTLTATDWRTIEGGMSRLPEAFKDLIKNKLRLRAKVSKLSTTKEGRVSVQWKRQPMDAEYEHKDYDYVIVNAPLTVIRNWQLPSFSWTLKRAIWNLQYTQSCKMWMEFSRRFWEEGDRPIRGGCSETDLPVKMTCYPDFGGDKAMLLASYSYGSVALGFSSVSDEDFVEVVLDNLVEMHGEVVRETYSGRYIRKCWATDPYASGAFAFPSAGQHKLLLPAFSKMEHNIVFVGEHASIKHAWISAALDSAIRGVVMILLDQGKVMEAKNIAKRWGADWLNI